MERGGIGEENHIIWYKIIIKNLVLIFSDGFMNDYIINDRRIDRKIDRQMDADHT